MSIKLNLSKGTELVRLRTTASGDGGYSEKESKFLYRLDQLRNSLHRQQNRNPTAIETYHLAVTVSQEQPDMLATE